MKKDTDKYLIVIAFFGVLKIGWSDPISWVMNNKRFLAWFLWFQSYNNSKQLTVLGFNIGIKTKNK